MNSLGKLLIITGLFIAMLGVGFIVFSRLKVPFLGRLPGDILIRRENFTFYFPLATSIIISITLSLIFYIISKIHR
jgi:hypothetical protein